MMQAFETRISETRAAFDAASYARLNEGLAGLINSHDALVRSLKEFASCRLADETVALLEIGCGTGLLTRKMLHASNRLAVTTIDASEVACAETRRTVARMSGSERIHVEVVHADAHTFLESCLSRKHKWDVIASGFVLHNLERGQRAEVHELISRCLTNGGLFINADLFAPGGRANNRALMKHVDELFAVYEAAADRNVLREWVLHSIEDMSPDRVMEVAETIEQLKAVGFSEVTFQRWGRLEGVMSGKMAQSLSSKFSKRCP